MLNDKKLFELLRKLTDKKGTDTTQYLHLYIHDDKAYFGSTDTRVMYLSRPYDFENGGNEKYNFLIKLPDSFSEVKSIKVANDRVFVNGKDVTHRAIGDSIGDLMFVRGRFANELKLELIDLVKFEMEFLEVSRGVYSHFDGVVQNNTFKCGYNAQGEVTYCAFDYASEYQNKDMRLFFDIDALHNYAKTLKLDVIDLKARINVQRDNLYDYNAFMGYIYNDDVSLCCVAMGNYL